MPTKKNILVRIHARAKQIKAKRKNLPYSSALKLAGSEIRKENAKGIGAARRKPAAKKAAPKKRSIKRTVKSKMTPVKKVTTLTETAMIGELKSRIKGIIGKAYAEKITCKTKRERAVYDKIIIENKKKLKKLS